MPGRPRPWRHDSGFLRRFLFDAVSAHTLIAFTIVLYPFILPFEVNIFLTYLGNTSNHANMNATAKSKNKKTFPLEIEESLHKALKHKAIESDMSLHAYIIDALVLRVNEETVTYNAEATIEENRRGK